MISLFMPIFKVDELDIDGDQHTSGKLQIKYVRANTEKDAEEHCLYMYKGWRWSATKITIEMCI